MGPTPDGASAPRVTAIVVAHNGARWIPNLINGLEASTRFPDAIIAVDTGSTDDSRDLLTAALGPEVLVDAPFGSGFGDAVREGVAAADRTPGTDGPSDSDWLWLLHDDCTPAPDALQRLLELVADQPQASIVGCRIRAWPRARRLLEVGVTITGTGHRETGLELGEYDQGQHDGVRRVLSVSSAGMLVRRDVWDRLGGFDGQLPLFRDDTDFGWRAARAGERVVISPDAVLFHAEAASRGVRPIDNTSASPHRADRRAALFTVLANCSLWVLPLQYIRLLIGSLLRAIGYLVGKLPSAALDELAALPPVLLRPDRVLRARAARRRTASASRGEVRTLLPSWWTPYANGIEQVSGTVADVLRNTATGVATSARRLRGGRGIPAREGQAADDVVEIGQGVGPLAWVLLHPVSTLAIVLAVVAAIASRGLWGSGQLQGGGLLPAPDGAGDWWGMYAESWHPVALGSTDAASPYVAALATVATVLVGKAWLAVDLVMLFAAPLCAIGAFLAARRLVGNLAVQFWMAVSYAVLPVVTGVVTSGRIGTVAAAVFFPWLVVAVWPLFRLDRAATWRPAFATAIVLALIGAFTPLGYLLAVALLIPAVGWLTFHRRLDRIGGLVIAVAVPAVLLMPWSLRFVSDPLLLLTEAGALDSATREASSAAWQLPFGRLEAAGDAPWWLTAGFLAAAVIALLRSDRRGPIAGAWTAIAISLGTAALVSGRIVTVPGSTEQAYAWIGLPVLIAQAAAIVAAGLAADGITGFIQRGSFGWRQPLAALTAAIAIATPIVALAWWAVVAPHGDLERTADDTLPAYVTDALRTEAQQRVLVLTGSASAVDYDLILDDGVRLGDDSVDPQYGSDVLDELVARMLSESGGADAARLAAFGIGYVMLPSPADPDLATALDGLPGLTRASTDPDQVVGWEIAQPTGLVRVFDPQNASDATIVGSSSGRASQDVPAGPPDRLVGLAVPPDQEFRATLDGTELPAGDAGGTTEFRLGQDGGTLEVQPSGNRLWSLLGQGFIWLLAIVLATPSIAKREGIAEVEA